MKKSPGFTMIELVVVMAIAAFILVGTVAILGTVYRTQQKDFKKGLAQNLAMVAMKQIDGTVFNAAGIYDPSLGSSGSYLKVGLDSNNDGNMDEYRAVCLNNKNLCHFAGVAAGYAQSDCISACTDSSASIIAQGVEGVFFSRPSGFSNVVFSSFTTTRGGEMVVATSTTSAVSMASN